MCQVCVLLGQLTSIMFFIILVPIKHYFNNSVWVNVVFFYFFSHVCFISMLFDDLKVYICPIDCALFHNFMMINVSKCLCLQILRKNMLLFLIINVTLKDPWFVQLIWVNYKGWMENCCNYTWNRKTVTTFSVHPYKASTCKSKTQTQRDTR